MKHSDDVDCNQQFGGVWNVAQLLVPLATVKKAFIQKGVNTWKFLLVGGLDRRGNWDDD